MQGEERLTDVTDAPLHAAMPWCDLLAVAACLPAGSPEELPQPQLVPFDDLAALAATAAVEAAAAAAAAAAGEEQQPPEDGEWEEWMGEAEADLAAATQAEAAGLSVEELRALMAAAEEEQPELDWWVGGGGEAAGCGAYGFILCAAGEF